MRSDESRWFDFGYGLAFLLSGTLLLLLPIATWSNSVIFAILFSPGLLLGPYFLFGSFLFLRDACFPGRSEE